MRNTEVHHFDILSALKMQRVCQRERGVSGIVQEGEVMD